MITGTLFATLNVIVKIKQNKNQNNLQNKLEILGLTVIFLIRSTLFI